MILFISMILPFITAIILWFWFKHKTTWYEFGIPFAVSFIVGLFLHIVIHSSLYWKIEYWTNYITKIEYYEPWDEFVIYPDIVSDGKNTRIVIKTKIEYHKPKYIAYDNENNSFNINKEDYELFKNRWKNSSFVEMNRKFHSFDGDMYYSKFNNLDKDMWIINTIHYYKNKIPYTSSVFNFKKISKEEKIDYDIVDYPDTYTGPILGNTSLISSDDVKNLDALNARFGSEYEIKVWMIIYKNKSAESATIQEHYWYGGNMNELVICVGINDQKEVQWAKTFSWTPKGTFTTSCKAEVESQIDQNLDINKIISWLYKNIPTQWERRDFNKDFDYLSVEVPLHMIVMSIIIGIIVNILVVAFVLENEKENDEIQQKREIKTIYRFTKK